MNTMSKDKRKDWKYYKDVMSTINNQLDTKMDIRGMFLHYIAVDSQNKFDSNIEFSDSPVSKALLNNDFETTYQKMGYRLSQKGNGSCLFALKTKKGIVVDHGIVEDYILDVHKELTFITLRSVDDFYMFNGTKVELFTKFEKIGDKVWKTNFVYNKTLIDREEVIIKSEVGKRIKVDSKQIPVELMFNNSLGLPDIPTYARQLIDEMSIYMNQIRAEFEKSKILMVFNKVFNSEYTADKFQQEIIAKRGHGWEVEDNDQSLANSVTPINLNGNDSSTRLEKLVSFFESKIRLYSHQFRDHITGSSQTNEFELASYNQQAFEYMVNKMAFRKRQLESFVKKVSQLMGKKNPVITMNLTPFEQNRIATLQAKTDSQVAQAEQARAIAKKNVAEAKLLTVSANVKKQTPIDKPEQKETTDTSEVPSSVDGRSEALKEIQEEVTNEG